jgi:hypothetical protein
MKRTIDFLKVTNGFPKKNEKDNWISESDKWISEGKEK